MNEPAIKWLWKVAGKIKIAILLLLITQVFIAILAVSTAWMLKSLINSAISGNKSEFIVNVFLFLGIIAGQITLAAVNRYLQEYSKSSAENCFKKRLFSCLMTKDYEQVTAVHSGEWLNRLTSDTTIIAEGVTVIVPEATGMIVKLLGALFSLIYLIPKLALALLPCGALMVLLTYAFRRVLKKMHRKIQESDGRLRVFMSERLSSLMMVKIFAKEKQTTEQAAEKMSDHKMCRMQRNHFSNVCNIGFGIIMRGAYALGAIYCGYGILSGSMNYGTFTAVLQLISQIQSPFANITGYLPKYYAMTASAERLMEAECLNDDCSGESISTQDINKFYHNEFESIVFEGLNFTYKSPSDDAENMPIVLKNLDLEIKKGEYTAFTGHSGCGKSTVLKLIAALYKEDSGKKYLKTSSGKINLDASERGLFAYVPQGNQLMSGTIREIVAFFDNDKLNDTEKIWRALKIACADEFVSELKDGLDTRLGERGAGLSEGQTQRIAIARAVFTERPILLLDEATSSLDEITEKNVLENLKNMTDKTVVIVTHRPAALEICGKIINFSNDNINVEVKDVRG